MEQITIKLHYKGEMIDYPIEGEMVGDYAVHPVTRGRMFNGRCQHGPHYTVSTPGGYTISAFKSLSTAQALAQGLAEFVTAAELESATLKGKNRNVTEIATLNMARTLINEYFYQEQGE